MDENITAVIEETPVEQIEDKVSEDAIEETKTTEESEEIVVTIGDEPLPVEDSTPAPSWTKELRKSNKILHHENNELKRELEALRSPQKKEDLIQEPTLEDHDYDEDKFKSATKKWLKQQNDIEIQNANEIAQQQKEHQQWQSKIDAYNESKTKVKVKDFEDAEDIVRSKFSRIQQGILLDAVENAENVALLVYALGKNPKKVEELAAINSPIKLAAAVAKLEVQLKVSPRKAPPPEEVVVKSSGGASSSVDSTLERLRAEASKTGDYTKVMDYKRMKKNS